jgi:hypothetical protein
MVQLTGQKNQRVYLILLPNRVKQICTCVDIVIAEVFFISVTKRILQESRL